MINLAATIMKLFPDSINIVDFLVKNDGAGEYIAIWNLTVAQPTQEQLNAEWIVMCKDEKILILDEECQNRILLSFTCDAVGNTFSFDAFDQINFNQQYIILIGDASVATVEWKTEDVGIKTFTREQFLQIIKSAENHKRSLRKKYWNLKAFVNNLATEDEINAVTWDTVVADDLYLE